MLCEIIKNKTNIDALFKCSEHKEITARTDLRTVSPRPSRGRQRPDGPTEDVQSDGPKQLYSLCVV